MTDDSGRPDITFDPCLDIPDEALVEAGYDPASAESTDYPMGTYTFLSCTYWGSESIPGELRRFSLSVLAGNVTLEEEREKVGAIATDTTVNGRSALFEYDAEARKECAITVQTAFGIVIFSRLYHPAHVRPLSREQRCDGLTETVERFEIYIADDVVPGGEK